MPTAVRFNPPGDVPGPPVKFESEDMGDPGAGFGFESDHTYEGDWFFFHTDHLGSTSYLTDTAGNVSQFVCYTPYGEAIVDEHLTTYENPFKFSGKELDDITGLYDHELGQETRYQRCGMGWTQGMRNFRRCLHSRTAVGIQLG